MSSDLNSPTLLGDQRVVNRPIESLKEHPRNPRTHSRSQVRKLAESIHRFGFVNPVLVDADNQIIAGHGRVAAARQLDMTHVPTLRIEHLSEADRRAYVLADNRLAELAGWDTELLALELEYIQEIDASFDLTVIGWDTPALDTLLNDGADPDEDEELANITVASGPPTTVAGDVWILGEHRLLCGDARHATAYERLLGDERAELVLTDPPYNVRIAGHVSGLGSAQHREFAMASGEMSEAEFTCFLRIVFRNLVQCTADGSLHFICMDWRHVSEVLDASRGVYAELKNLIVWNKSNAGMGSLYRSQHELLFLFKHGRAPHVNNIELGRHGRHRSNVWSYAGVNTFRRGRQRDLESHPTVKPVNMLADAMLDCSNRGARVLDCFGGSGSTVLAAERVGRCARVIEIDPAYADVTVRRWQVRTGGKAVLEGSGEAFDTRAVRLAGDARAEVHHG